MCDIDLWFQFPFRRENYLKKVLLCQSDRLSPHNEPLASLDVNVTYEECDSDFWTRPDHGPRRRFSFKYEIPKLDPFLILRISFGVEYIRESGKLTERTSSPSRDGQEFVGKVGTADKMVKSEKERQMRPPTYQAVQHT